MTVIDLWPQGAPHRLPERGEHPPVTLTAYPAEGARAAVIVCPGGGYGALAPHEGEPIARWLNGIGISAFVLRYRIAPHAAHPAALSDAQRAIRYVRHHAGRWGLEPNRIGILGFSAGGHLASTAGTHYDAGRPDAPDPLDRVSSRPDAMILCYPVISFGEHGHRGSMVNLLGEEPAAELRDQLSNENRVTADTPPAFLWHTSDDSSVKVENVLLFAAALSRCGVPFDLHVYEKGIHGLGLAEDDAHVRRWTEECGSWLKRQGFRS